MKKDLNFYIGVVSDEYEIKYFNECRLGYIDETKYSLIRFMGNFQTEIHNKAIILFEKNIIREDLITELTKEYNEKAIYSDIDGVNLSLKDFIALQSFKMEEDVNYLFVKKKVSYALSYFFLDGGRKLDFIIRKETERLIENRKMNDDTFKLLWDQFAQGEFINNFTDEDGNRLWRGVDVIQYYESKVIDNLTNNPLFLPFLIAWETETNKL